MAAVFPALFRQQPPSLREERTEADDATCFYHPDNRAVSPCDSCGRFLCNVCTVELGGETLCPGCIDVGIRTRNLTRLEHRRVLYDNVALALATVPALLIWPTIFTGPMAIWIAIRYWNAPLSVVHRNKVRMILAIVFGFAQIAFWAFIVYGVAVTRGVA
jgi:hypothetical protein